MKILLQEATKLQDVIIQDRRHIHKNAEIHNDLPLTTEYVMRRLKEMGYEPKEICKSGVVAIAGGKKSGKTILLRADMDALPIIEETDVPFKSTNNYMHACGHDMHTAMLLGAAQLLKNHENELEGQVKLMFQPAEETLFGAKSMIDAGVLENPKVDAAMMIHVAAGAPIPSGLVLLAGEGVISASSDWFKIKVQGKGGHGAMPNFAVDPLNVISHINIALQEINAREIAPSDTIALTVGEMHGGNAANIIPDSAYLTGTIRTFNSETREFIKKRIEEIATGIATGFRASVTFEYPYGCPSVLNNGELLNQFKQYSTELLSPEQVIDASKLAGGAFAKMSGSEDFGYVSELVPSIMVSLSTTSSDESYKYPHHHPKAKFNEDPMFIGAAVYANTAIEWLKNNK